MNRRHPQSSSHTYRPKSDAFDLKFDALVDLIEQEGDRLARRSENVVASLSRTLESNIHAARKVVSLGPNHELKEAEERRRKKDEELKKAEEQVARAQHAADEAYRAAPWPWRWFGAGVSEEVRAAVQEARSHLAAKRAEHTLHILGWHEKYLSPSTPPSPPLDTIENAEAFIERAKRAQVTLHSAMAKQRDMQAERAKRAQARARAREREKAMAGAYQNRVRMDADTIKRRLRRDHPCPYCGGSLGAEPHADHIHPVSHGGLSTEDNMVYACQRCNNRKHDKTLREFARKYGLNRDAIEQRLEGLGKRV